MAVRPEPKPSAAIEQPTQPPRIVAETTPPPAATVTPAPIEAPTPHPVIHKPVREKPSAMPPPVRPQRPVIITRNEEPPPPPFQPFPEPTPLASVEPAPPPVVERAAPAVPAPEPAAVRPDQEGPGPHTVTIAAGTLLPVRIGETVSSARNQPGDNFLATLDRPLVIDGFIIAEKGSRVEGRVAEAEPAGRAKGLAHLGIELVRISTSDGQHVRIRTEPYRKDGPSSTGADAAKSARVAVIGAAIGALAGGGKGAAIGAGVGGAAGTAMSC